MSNNNIRRPTRREGGQAMTKEQEEAIERIKYNDIAKPLYCGDITICNIDDLKTVLSMLEEKEKQIDLMAKYMEMIQMTISHIHNIVVNTMQKLESIDFISLDKRKENQKLVNEAYNILDSFKDELIREDIKRRHK